MDHHSRAAESANKIMLFYLAICKSGVEHTPLKGLQNPLHMLYKRTYTFHRVPYIWTYLQVSDFLMRVKSGRFPSIEKDMKMVLAHCGSLLLDPAALCHVST